MDVASDTRHYGVCDVRNLDPCRNALPIGFYLPMNGFCSHSYAHRSQSHRGNWQDPTAAVDPAAAFVEPAAAFVEPAAAFVEPAAVDPAAAFAEPAVVEPAGAVVERVPQ
jgi:hypothetical protein